VNKPATISDFRYVSFAQEVIFGRGELARLGEVVERYGWKRFLVCTSRSVRASGHVEVLEAILGIHIVATFDGVRPHVQDVQVEEATALATENQVDVIIGMGGGSPIGMAKAAAYALEQERIGPQKSITSSISQPLIPVIAIPTTYAGSEMTAVYGITHSRETPPRKITVSNPRIAPKLVVYDPELTLDLPPELTASSGINALAHCMEALYSVTRHPLASAAAVSGVGAISDALLECYEHADNLAARTQMLVGSHLAGLSLASTSMGLHHGICHVLGGSANVPHGIANSIMLPHVIRFNADVVVDQLLPAAEALGISLNGIRPNDAVESVAQKIFDLVGRMNLPQRLRDVGVGENDLPRLAEIGFQNRTVQNNIKPIHDAAQIEALLKAAW
jgi:maleylacetate reductase